MDPFIPEKEERYTTTKTASNSGSKGLMVLVICICLVLAAMCGVLITMMLTQQKTFDSLQQNVQHLQTSISGETPAEKSAPEPAQPQQAPTAAPENSAVDPGALSDLKSNLQKTDRELSTLSSKFGELESAIRDVSKSSGSGGVTDNQLRLQANRLSQEIARLKKDVLETKLSLDSVQSEASARATATDRRIASIENALMNLNSTRLNQPSSGASDDVIAGLRALQRDVRLLKKQHPYLKE